MANLLFAKPPFIRVAGALGATALAVVFVGLVPFLSVDPSAGADLQAGSAFSVNRELKGDRLPLSSDTNPVRSQNESYSSRGVRTPSDIPVGCDSSFSPISAPQLATVFGRCTT